MFIILIINILFYYYLSLLFNCVYLESKKVDIKLAQARQMSLLLILKKRILIYKFNACTLIVSETIKHTSTVRVFE